VQWCSEEVSEDSGAESALTSPGTLRKGKIKATSVSTEILKFSEYLSSHPLFVVLSCRSLQPCTLVYVPIQQFIPFQLHLLYTSHPCSVLLLRSASCNLHALFNAFSD